MKRTSLVVVICATLLALTVVLGWLPYVFLVPTLFAACCFGFGISFFASTSFGVVSLILFLMFPGMSPTLAWYFTEFPWLPIVARMFIGPIIHAFYLLMNKLFKNKGTAGKVVSASTTAILGSFLNTLFVGTLIFLIGSDQLPIDLDKITLGFLALNGVIEIAITAIVVPPLVITVRKATPKLFLQLELYDNKSREYRKAKRAKKRGDNKSDNETEVTAQND